MIHLKTVLLGYATQVRGCKSVPFVVILTAPAWTTVLWQSHRWPFLILSNCPTFWLMIPSNLCILEMFFPSLWIRRSSDLSFRGNCCQYTTLHNTQMVYDMGSNENLTMSLPSGEDFRLLRKAFNNSIWLNLPILLVMTMMHFIHNKFIVLLKLLIKLMLNILLTKVPPFSINNIHAVWSTLLGQCVSCHFSDGIYIGTITVYDKIMNTSTFGIFSWRGFSNNKGFHQLGRHRSCYVQKSLWHPILSNNHAHETDEDVCVPNNTMDAPDQVSDSDYIDTSGVNPVTNLQQSNHIWRNNAKGYSTSFLTKAGICFLNTCSLLMHLVANKTCQRFITEQEINCVFTPPTHDSPSFSAVIIKKEEELCAYHSYCEK